MQIEQLRYFCMIVEQKTFSEAAYVLHISQSSLSKHMMKLEQELDAVLFDRSRRQIVLTKEGQQVYQDALGLLRDYDALRKNLSRLKEQDSKRLCIAMLPVFSQYSLGRILQRFLRSEQCQGTIQEIEERDMSSAIQENYDMYILRGDYEELSGYPRYRSSEDELVALAAKQHPLAQKEMCSFSDFKNERLLLFPRYTIVTKLCEQACRNAGFSPEVARYGRLETLLGAAREQEGIVLAMKGSLTQYQLHGLNLIPIQDTVKSCLYLYVNPASARKDSMRKLLSCLKAAGEVST